MNRLSGIRPKKVDPAGLSFIHILSSEEDSTPGRIVFVSIKKNARKAYETKKKNLKAKNFRIMARSRTPGVFLDRNTVFDDVTIFDIQISNLANIKY